MNIGLAIFLASILLVLGILVVSPYLINYFFDTKYKYFQKVIGDMSKAVTMMNLANSNKKERENNEQQ